MASVSSLDFMMIVLIIINVIIIAFSVVDDSKAGECACYSMSLYELVCVDTETRKSCEIK